MVFNIFESVRFEVALSAVLPIAFVICPWVGLIRELMLLVRPRISILKVLPVCSLCFSLLITSLMASLIGSLKTSGLVKQELLSLLLMLAAFDTGEDFNKFVCGLATLLGTGKKDIFDTINFSDKYAICYSEKQLKLIHEIYENFL